MSLFFLEPEVAGNLGENTTYANLTAIRERRERPIVQHLHYECDVWLGNELLTATPCFIVTELLAADLLASDLSGVVFEDLEISTSEEYEDRHKFRPDMPQLPSFRRLIPAGKVVLDEATLTVSEWSGHDICVSVSDALVVTDRALEVLKRHALAYCDVHPLNMP